ncbi:MAG: dihydrolipoyllysine-residue acetyltransferase [Pseudomonadota bacterium]
MAVKDIRVPDIGDFDSVEIIEVLVAPGDTVAAEDSLITLESDKASMEVPAPEGGRIVDLKVALGDSVAEGDVIATIEAGEATADPEPPAAAEPAAPPAPPETAPAETAQAEPVPAEAAAAPAAATSGGGGTIEITVPDIGDFDDVEIIEVLVGPGDSVAAEDSLITLESDKASMEVPAPQAGTIVEMKVEVGGRVGEGDVIAILEAAAPAAADPAPPPAAAPPAPAAAKPAPTEPEAPRKGPRTPPVSFDASRVLPDSVPHASPSVRRFARELGVDLAEVNGTGRKGRIVKADVEGYVKGVMQQARRGGAGATQAPAGSGLSLLDWPKVDFAKFGEIETRPLSRIQKISGANLSRNWVMIPHVTQHDEADITEMEAFRKSHSEAAKAAGYKLTPLAFLIKAVVAALKEFPTFNASLDPESESLVLKKYFHVGVAVDTPDGLVVPVVRDCDQKSLYELASDVVAASIKARDKKLSPTDMQGGCFSISSLGGIGGTAFTPIINAPEVAILGVSRSVLKPVWNGKEFEPRLMLPLSLSYDHRVIDGATAARFTGYLAHVLGDIRRLLL